MNTSFINQGNEERTNTVWRINSYKISGKHMPSELPSLVLLLRLN